MKAFRNKNADEILTLFSTKDLNETKNPLHMLSEMDDLTKTLDRVNKRNAEWSKMVEFGHNFSHIENIFDIKFPAFFVK